MSFPGWSKRCTRITKRRVYLPQLLQMNYAVGGVAGCDAILLTVVVVRYTAGRLVKFEKYSEYCPALPGHRVLWINISIKLWSIVHKVVVNRNL